jgi:hypothetical protein
MPSGWDPELQLEGLPVRGFHRQLSDQIVDAVVRLSFPPELVVELFLNR